MKKFLLVLVFAVSFVLKASSVFAVDAVNSVKPKTKTLKPAKVMVTNSEAREQETASTNDEGDSSEMRIQNNITFGQVSGPVDNNNNKASASPVTSNSNNTSEAKVGSSGAIGISLIPMAGGTMYQGSWNSHIRNNYTFGVALELSIIPALALEVEAAQGRYYISYSNYGHNFTQYTYGGSAKFYLTKGLVQTYLGAGVLGITYQNMTYGINSLSTYDRSIGAGQALAGAEIALSHQVSIGVRASYIAPLFNRVSVMSNGGYAVPSYEEYSAMDTAMYRLMGAVKITL